ncbi:TD and POZ domain-containing protein 3-like [Frankliniella occidentalis]|uniref:TD and POZ domain-containing protein 3-like n=1 Tax=Frankliniella occidentalis TaxID=133901 RepID=A0A9C6U1K0_FRAOC|nr:TD and POZ domain-containing protein 3-like [Frankliniella occidentalis]
MSLEQSDRCKSTASGCVMLPLPSPNCSTKLPPFTSSDGLWSWTIDLHVVEVVQQDPNISGGYRIKVFCTATDQNDPSSERAVTWGGGVRFDELDYDSSCELSDGNRFLKKQYLMDRLVPFRNYLHEYGFSYNFHVIVTQSVPIPEHPKLSASGPARLSKSLCSLFNSGLMSDVKLCSEGHEIAAHRIILAARSEYFKVKFKPEWDGDSVAIDLPLPVLKEMINYIYTGDLGDDVDMIKLLIAADRYLVTDLCDEITERLPQSLVSQNKPAASVFCDLLKTSVILNSSPSLRSIALQFFKSHRDEVLQSKDWAEFQADNRQVAAESLLDMYNLPD